MAIANSVTACRQSAARTYGSASTDLMEAAATLTRAGDNKGGRDGADYLPVVALELVKGIVTFEPFILAWQHSKERLWGEFHSIQDAAGSKLVCTNADRRECTDTCHIDGFTHCDAVT